MPADSRRKAYEERSVRGLAFRPLLFKSEVPVSFTIVRP